MTRLILKEHLRFLPSRPLLSGTSRICVIMLTPKYDKFSPPTLLNKKKYIYIFGSCVSTNLIDQPLDL
jgi:hypothetical protein